MRAEAAMAPAWAFGAILAAGGAVAQGVPVFDGQAYARRAAIVAQGERDVALQRARLAREREVAAIAREQLAALDGLLEATTRAGPGDAGAMIGTLEAGAAPEAGASALYGEADLNPAAPRLFGDAAGTVEALIVEVAKETYGLPGPRAAGLSPVQWRCLLQALIWQESRFTVDARSPADAYGLTQIIPGTARQLGIYPAYYESPYLQVHGGARYLSAQLAAFDGNIVHALAAYNAGPGRVIEYGGVPPFAETEAYVRLIPERYNLYLARVGGIDALGTIDPVELANSTRSLTADAAGAYGDHAVASARAAAERLSGIVARIDQTADLHQALALNAYARAELARLVAARTRLKAARAKPVGADQMALAADRVAEQAFLDFTLEAVR